MRLISFFFLLLGLLLAACHPDRSTRFYNRAMAVREDPVQAVSWLDQAIRVDSMQPVYWYERGKIHRELEQYEAALEDFRQMKKVGGWDPVEGYVWQDRFSYETGLTYLEQGNDYKARDYLMDGLNSFVDKDLDTLRIAHYHYLIGKVYARDTLHLEDAYFNLEIAARAGVEGVREFFQQIAEEIDYPREILTETDRVGVDLTFKDGTTVHITQFPSPGIRPEECELIGVEEKWVEPDYIHNLKVSSPRYVVSDWNGRQDAPSYRMGVLAMKYLPEEGHNFLQWRFPWYEDCWIMAIDGKKIKVYALVSIYWRGTGYKYSPKIHYPPFSDEGGLRVYLYRFRTKEGDLNFIIGGHHTWL